MSTYSSNLRIELITTGTQAGTWGNTTNDNYQYILEQAIAGNVSVSVTSANQALTYLNGPTATASANQSVRAILTLSTTTGANFAVYAPPVSKQYTIYNSSSYTATIYNSTVIGNTTAAGTGIAVPAGKTMTVWSDGTNFYQQNTALISPALSGTPTAPTALTSDNSTQVATTAFVKNQAYATLASPALTGTPTAPTAAPGTNTTQIATTAFVQSNVTSAVQAAYPVGSIYMNASNGTNPATLLGFGTWVALGAGRMLVGFSSGDPLFGTAGNTGGSRDATLPSHTHTVTDPGHNHTYNYDAIANVRAGSNGPTPYTSTPTTTGSAFTGISIDTAGTSPTNANLPPYLTVYMWQRTA